MYQKRKANYYKLRLILSIYQIIISSHINRLKKYRVSWLLMELTNYGLISITRKLGAHYIEKKGEDIYLTDNVLAICLPFGNTAKQGLKLKFFNGKYYFSVVRIFSDNEGMGIICALDSISDLIDDKLNTLRYIFKFLNSKSNNELKLFIDFDSIIFNQNLLIEIDNIQSAIISILLNKKLFVLDDNYQIFSLILSLKEFLPEKFHKFLGFTIDSTSFTENINIMSFQDSKDIISHIESLENNKSTIIDMENKICFGIYTSPLMSQVLEFLKKNSKQEAQDLLKIFETLSFETDKISIKSSEFVRKHKISKADIKIIDLIRLNILDLPVKRNIFEELVK